MKLYKDNNGRWRVDEGIVPAGACFLRKKKNVVEIYFLDGRMLYQGAVSEIERSDQLQITEVILSGTNGNMTIAIGDAEGGVSLHTTLENAAASFVALCADDFLPGVVVTSDGDKIIFTAAAMRTRFEVVVIPRTGDLYGEISDDTLPTTYEDYDTFIEECGDFFCNPAQISA